MGNRSKTSAEQNPNEPDGENYDSRIAVIYYTNAHYQIVYDYRVQTIWDELIKLSGLPTLLFYLFKFCLSQYQLHIADIDMVEDIERMGQNSNKKANRNAWNGDKDT